MSKHKIYSEKEIQNYLKRKLTYRDETAELYEAEGGCKHVVHTCRGGGVECMRCGGWCCY